MKLQSLNKQDVIPALEDNIQGRFTYLPEQIQGMEVRREGGLLIVNSHELSDMFNIVCCTGTTTATKVEHIVNDFKRDKVPFAWWQGFEKESKDLKEWLEQQGLQKTEEELAMAALVEKSLLPDASPELTIKPVDNEKSLQDFIDILIKLIPDESQALQRFYHKASPILYSPTSLLKLFVGYINDEPVGTCSAYFSDKVVGIFDIIALPEYRGRGIGTGMTVKAMSVAIEAGYSICVLTATDDAKYLYQKIGFVPVNEMSVYSDKQ